MSYLSRLGSPRVVAPNDSPSKTAPRVIARIDQLRRERKVVGAAELAGEGVRISVSTVGRGWRAWVASAAAVTSSDWLLQPPAGSEDRHTLFRAHGSRGCEEGRADTRRRRARPRQGLAQACTTRRAAARTHVRPPYTAVRTDYVFAVFGR